MGLTKFRVYGAVKGLCMAAGINLSACASFGKLAAVAEASSCTNPVILKHVPKSETKASLSVNDIPEIERIARVRVMGFKTATPVSGSGCSEPGITKYQLAGTDEAPASHLYVKHMTKTAIKQDPNIKCKPTFTQVYQPPLKLGGAGRVIMVPSGERCVGGNTSVQKRAGLHNSGVVSPTIKEQVARIEAFKRDPNIYKGRRQTLANADLSESQFQAMSFEVKNSTCENPSIFYIEGQNPNRNVSIEEKIDRLSGATGDMPKLIADVPSCPSHLEIDVFQLIDSLSSRKQTVYVQFVIDPVKVTPTHVSHTKFSKLYKKAEGYKIVKSLYRRAVGGNALAAEGLLNIIDRAHSPPMLYSGKCRGILWRKPWEDDNLRHADEYARQSGFENFDIANARFIRALLANSLPRGEGNPRVERKFKQLMMRGHDMTGLWGRLPKTSELCKVAGNYAKCHQENGVDILELSAFSDLFHKVYLGHGKNQNRAGCMRY